MAIENLLSPMPNLTLHMQQICRQILDFIFPRIMAFTALEKERWYFLDTQVLFVY